MLIGRRLVTSLLASLLLLLTMAPHAMAGPVSCGAGKSLVNGRCAVTVAVAGGGSGTRGSSKSHSSPAASCEFYGKPIACRQGQSWWSNARQCYVEFVSPQPAKSDPTWMGHTTGAVYGCYLPRNGGGNKMYWFWSASAPAGPDPATLARRALAAMNLTAIRIGMVPEPRPGSVGIIGMPVWLWVDQPDSRTWGPITRSASAAGASVTATAKVSKVVWSMGDGTTIVCSGPGTVYQDRFGRSPSPSCGHVYEEQGTYTVQATSYWTVSWRGMGASGTIPLQLSRSIQVVEGEIQVIVTSGDR